MKKKQIIVLILIVLVVLAGILGIYLKQAKKEEPKKPRKKDPVIVESNDFNWQLIQTVNKTQKGNYLISPYSIEIALTMLKEGSSGNSREQIEKVLTDRTINDIRLKDRIGVANATFMKDKYQKYIEESFISTLKEEYEADVILDPFTKPTKINDWVNQKTNGMIPSILDSMDPNFVIGIANALAIDVDWRYSFECQDTTKETFTKADGTTMKTEMMHRTYGRETTYFETENAKGVIIPYQKYSEDGEELWEEEGKGTQLEFIAILPNENTTSYIEVLEEEMQKIENNQKEDGEDLDIRVALPRFKYDFDLRNFKEVLMEMGITDVFDGGRADLTNIMTAENREKANLGNLYVGTAIHKTHIELNEKGTKAAAITYFGVKDSAMMQEPKYIEITFNKPFIYMIRDKETKELLFFGVTEEPNKWEGTTCEKEKNNK